MGIDAMIYVKRRNQERQASNEWMPPEATEQVTTYDGRYWSPSYPRGYWPDISAVLLPLLADPSVERVWYCGDNLEDGAEPFTMADFLLFTHHYITGNTR